MKHALKHALAGLVLVAGLAGCGQRNEMTEITGSVTYDGKRLQKGVVNFFPSDGQGRSASAVIAEGCYKVRMTPGRKKVQIEGFRVIGKEHAQPTNPNSPIIDKEEQMLPQRYNVQSQLTADITSDLHVLDFPLAK